MTVTDSPRYCSFHSLTKLIVKPHTSPFQFFFRIPPWRLSSYAAGCLCSRRSCVLQQTWSPKFHLSGSFDLSSPWWLTGAMCPGFLRFPFQQPVPQNSCFSSTGEAVGSSRQCCCLPGCLTAGCPSSTAAIYAFHVFTIHDVGDEYVTIDTNTLLF